METSKEFSRMRVVELEGVESRGEYVLPDYKGDVKKILYSRAVAEGSGRYQSAGMLESAGIVCYDIVYLDSEDRITPLSFTTDYDYSVKCADEAYLSSRESVRVENYGLRLMGPRKFSAKANLSSEVYISEAAEYSVGGNAPASEGIEMRTKEVSISTGSHASSAEQELAEELTRIEGAIVDEVEVLFSTAEPRGITVSGDRETKEVRCEIVVTALIKCRDESPYTVEDTISFREVIPASDIEGALSAEVDIHSHRVDVNPEENGVSVTTDIIASATVFGEGNTPLRIVVDCYSTERGTELDMGEFCYTEYISGGTGGEKLMHEMPRGEIGAEYVRDVLFSTATARVDSVEKNENTAIIKGAVRFGGVACEINEDGVLSYAPIKLEAPFEINVNLGVQIPDLARIIASVGASSASIELDGDLLRASCNLTAHASAYVECREPCVTFGNLTEERYGHDPSLVRVYYPLPGESLFEVAKKFHTSSLALARDNELTEQVFRQHTEPGSLAGIHALIIK